MVKNIPGEKWEPFRFKGHKSMRNKYAISSQGRIASYTNDLKSDGKILKGSITAGYRTFNLHVDGSSITLYVHREVARTFVPKKSPKEKIVIHLNHDKTDNRSKNLKWVAVADATAHQQKSPARKAYKLKQQNLTKGHKLTVSMVRSIKSTLANPKRKQTNRQLAQKYNVSEMTIYRIQRGESWGRV